MFLTEHKVVESLPENAKLIVLNHELTLQQVIEAMVGEHNSNFAIIWNSERREFTGIVTLRNLLELITSLCESYDSWLREFKKSPAHKDENFQSLKAQRNFTEFFLEIKISQNEKGDLSETSIQDISQESIGFHPTDLNKLNIVERHDWSIIPKVLQ